MQILTDLTKEINNYHQIINNYDSGKTNTMRFLIENYNTATGIIKKINDLHPDLQNHHDLWEMVDSAMYSEFMKIHKKTIESLEKFAQNCSKIVEMTLVFCINQEEGEKFYIAGVTNTSSAEALMETAQIIIKSVQENNDLYLNELINSSIKYQEKLKKEQDNKTTPNIQQK